MTTPRKSINPAFLKLKPHRDEIEEFKHELLYLIDHINVGEHEEHNKNLLRDFLKKTYYDPDRFINTYHRKDLVVHTGKNSDSPIGVIIETKSPSNKGEMCSKDNLNTKALQELLLYYLEERVEHQNTELKHLIVTNIHEYFIFKAPLFEKLVYKNKSFVKQFRDFKLGGLSGDRTDFFYSEIAKPFIDKICNDLEYAYLDIRDLEKTLRKNDPNEDKKLIAPFKLFSPEHMLVLPFTNDSNSLDKKFYSELLHIIGLKEIKEGSKKLIQRYPEGERNPASLLENAIDKLDSRDHLSQVDHLSSYGATREEQLFAVGLELCITWINRVLFLKLLEAQLLSYHKNNADYKFLNIGRLRNYDDLDNLFFSVLAKKQNERSGQNQKEFGNIPYLNSSLFEPAPMEHKTIFVTDLRDDLALPLIGSTVLKNDKGKKRSGSLNAIDYLFKFLDAYDFSSEGKEEIQEEHKTLINASVLGLIFEKINGYKDGSYFTPGFITEYMCRETIRRAVVQKFNEAKGWDCKDLTDLHNKDFDIAEANEIVNSLRICDPAVGSGHFLVSALNEILAIKHELRILCDAEGKRLKHYQVEVVNDELVVMDREDGTLFEYHPNDDESLRIQKALFHEKQTIIENCLFGVDINPNSVKICRLRLWIELLKNAYYKNDNELETLPNIDINIKCGNSLISRFDIKADLSKALKKSKYDIGSYRDAVQIYQNAKDKDEKRKMRDLIDEIKGNFRTEIYANDPKLKRLYKLQGELFNETNQQNLFSMNPKEKAAWEKKIAKLSADLQKLEVEIEEIKNNKIYENAFEWRFEFPEVLDNDGNFVGFDVVIGNPPYFQIQKLDYNISFINKEYLTYEQMGDIYVLFMERGNQLLNANGTLSFITSNKWMRANYGKSLRKYLIDNVKISVLIDFNYYQVFDEASVDTCIILFNKGSSSKINSAVIINNGFKLEQIENYVKNNSIIVDELTEKYWSIIPKSKKKLNEKLILPGKPLKNWNIEINRGVLTGLNNAFIIDEKTRNLLVKKDKNNQEIIFPYLKGKNIKRYGFAHDNLYLIFTRRGINIEKYPTIKSYLESYKRLLSPRNNGDKIGRKPGQYKWYEIQDTVSYYEQFSKEKIVYAETMRIHKSDLKNFPRFGYDNDGFITDKTTFIISGPNLKILLAILNSRVGAYLIKEYITKLDSGGYMMQKVFFEEIPILVPSNKDLLNKKVNDIIKATKQDQNDKIITLESEIDQLVYELYGLTEEEIRVVEGSA